MPYLEKEASKLYFDLTNYHYNIKEVSWTHYLDRMRALSNMCEPNDPICKKAKRIILVEDEEFEDDWVNEERDINIISKEGEQHEINHTSLRSRITQDEHDNIYFFCGKKGLNDWVFHQYDEDFHPSVPHGHFKGRKKPKLDAYLGWVYDGSTQKNRLKRDLIIELWNDSEFRIFARIAVEWYIRELPNFNWRVSNPLSFPRRR